MIKVGLLSDTHGYWDDKYNEYFGACDEIWHAGDIGSDILAAKLELLKPLRAVYGNIDGQTLRRQYTKIAHFTVEGVSVMMTHIGGYPGRYEPSIRKELYDTRPKLFIAGHSHILKVQYDKNLECLYMNPGAAGKSGFHQVRTLLRFALDSGSIKDLEVIELGFR
ncbi:putative phosphoesterase [Parabacteroides sp. PF5-5]|uniref:metallophosphoesterase family protein n=1 Tax=unclassified Parabacteroides TaxID=2649774 RepID=UPI002473108A|nr:MULTISPECIES: metallophosphoesterase family protein [unclassified Parabacteroides]MDH6305702.1 putative phosphoesterase [Parabacteroides sp. PH5-39]MDH6316774.1 putative phosphoesterase [Parabacteroides sp. PF5-13]MDH6320415.1 putative phosphoesterase [Parabacteroides sp. PH5-13]MDH6324145.1 putative phosphoesterase [Parabacteroides sp. PH5-8]MDH6327960.1 putative phosphoesterase [Parabacteroides sp. PH5-41]